MTKAPAKDDAGQRIGRAIALLRDRAGLTQAAAGENHVPPITPQWWGMHERGIVKAIFQPDVQAGLLNALGATPGDLDEALEMIGDDGDGTRITRLARELAGDPGPPRSRHAAPARQAVFPLPEGDVVITLPGNLTPEGFRQLKDYLAVFLRDPSQTTN